MTTTPNADTPKPVTQKAKAKAKAKNVTGHAATGNGAAKPETKAKAKGKGFSLILATTDRLIAMVKTLMVGYAKMHDQLHVMACSTIFHAAKHGDVRPLNQFYWGLNTNYSTAFRFWIGETFKRHEAARCLKFSTTDGWQVLPNTTKEREAFMGVIGKHLINPDGKTYLRFYERNIIQSALIFGDTNVVQALKGLVAKAERHDDKVQSHVSPELAIMLKGTLAKAEDYATRAETIN